MSRSDDIAEEIRLMDIRIGTYDRFMYLRNTGKIEVTDRITQIDFPALEKQALEHYRHILLIHWSLEKKQEEQNEQ